MPQFEVVIVSKTRVRTVVKAETEADALEVAHSLWDDGCLEEKVIDEHESVRRLE